MQTDNGVNGFKKVTLSSDEVDCLANGYDVQGNGIHITTEDNTKPIVFHKGNTTRSRVTLGELGQGRCMAPNDLEILIHFYVSPAQHPRQGAVDHDCERLEELGVLRLTGHNTKYSITGKGKAWMRCILDTPFPQNVWLDDHGHIIDINED